MATEETNKPEFVFRSAMTADNEYVKWLSEVKTRVKQAQSKAILQVNTSMLELYWSIGRDLVALHPEEKWGKGVVRQFALDMRNAFPEETGFSDTNIKYMRRWYEFYSQSDTISHQLGDRFSQQPADQLPMPEMFGRIPWKHHVLIFTKSQTREEAVFYIRQIITGNWSRRMLEDNLASNLFARQGAAVTNFPATMPAAQGGLVQEILKDPYNFDFLTMQQGYDERELENALMRNITRFLLELGKGFAFVGRQMELRMANGQSFFPDLVFYHIPQKRYVVVDLKAVGFKPEFAGKINFYVSAADELLRGEGDNDSIGLIICKEADRTIVEWSFRGVERPLGVATYQLQEVVDRTVAEIEAMNQE